MKRVRFAVDYPERLRHPLQRRLGEAGVGRADLLTWSPTADATTLFWVDGDPDAVERVVAGIDSLREHHAVPETEGTYLFLRQDAYEFPDAVLDAVAAARVVFLPPVTFHRDGTVRFEAVGETGALDAFHAELSALGDLTIERVRPFERERAPAPLTDRQRAALAAARDAGYYEVPREGTVADVAATLDCATSTAGELLRKAEAAVVRATLDGGSPGGETARSR